MTTGGFFVPVMKIRTGGTGSSYDLSKENEWEREGSAMGAKGSSELSGEKCPPRTPQAKSPPEQLKVFRAAEDAENEQTSPKGGRMFYTSETASKSGFPSSLFPLEASPRHQRKALNISEPFAVSVPLRVSAVISTNSTPCRVPTKEKLSLSSLEELSSLVAESTSSSALEVGNHTKTEQAPERKEKQPAPVLPAAASRGKSVLRRGMWRCPAAWWGGGCSSLLLWPERDQAVAGWVLMAAGQVGARGSNETEEWVASQQCPVVPGGSSVALLVGIGLKQQSTCFQSQVVTSFICLSDPGSHPEELVAARKPESLETPQPAAENQEALCGPSSCPSNTSSPRQSSEQSPTLEQTPASEVHTGPLPADKEEQGQLKTKDVSSEGSCGQQKIETTKTEEGSCLRDVVRKKT